MRVFSTNPRQTRELAAGLVKKILASPPHRKHARVLALVGDLGAGKTTFVQGFAKALGIKNRMVSPTFLIFRKYGTSIRQPADNFQFRYFYHVDVYRIQKSSELNALGFKKILSDPQNIVLIEWADKIKRILPKDTIWVRLEHGRHEKERRIYF
ncbi:MAG: tRNA (adenosine(37)-N6)-threonylcarbamoyltransferase complex ATPase subunit type 1 TsaE [Candidatus Harrisonbacteria bacterium RIFOXYA1_FULL_48_8]|uniref:tRNA threonylcarbamoyladenosine biosynthesis protein TsaE n=3 Tax=Parcubacteria group TaxID=1794811 RepID=A0A0G1T6C0_9BACT|nr:MAG: ATP-binding protein [Candidatus Giovannonibacteria bacterium GW2011_GWB1_47_6b]KKU95193.1 MAG: ATP-binding protein [Parcubacteria group bacterium GW2011_GWA1_48_11b]OGY63418.1 MAG: tRNA (adenosine(37)-N6)-threonylcarbamoyltransferase complex ATPase subunit type 1 TsaE [Candidatus Harrisonbacteria bacterium RIFCSPHIGHO2_12_FULL_48_16]OGY69043.1 MAG: tRNA (adenosine(37)-N6)-threonylcarbamoyltransferase complex ATPase subunit type 1 TsaE [Candidatus Harrisonbacteria bacterium RIFOXYA1_FULL_